MCGPILIQFSDVTTDVYAKLWSQSRSEVPTHKGAYQSDTPHNSVACFLVKLIQPSMAAAMASMAV